MRTPIFLLSILVFPTVALGQDDCRCWTPTAKQIAAVEAKIEGQRMPLGRLDRYMRYYAGVTDSDGDRRFIRGKLVPLGASEMPDVHIVDGKMPPLQEQGCISMSDPNGGPWIYFNCARAGTWTPSDTQIAELEDILRQKRERGLGFARHYAGVTEDNRQIIRGVFVENSALGRKPGIYVASEAELPTIFDGGCGIVHVRYDPSNKEITSRCGGR
jgi:hypothetical protein